MDSLNVKVLWLESRLLFLWKGIRLELRAAVNSSNEDHDIIGMNTKCKQKIENLQFFIFVIQVSVYLRKQMLEAEQTGAGESEDMKKMIADQDKLVEEIFQHEDKDKNGYISHDEFSGPKHDELWTTHHRILWYSHLKKAFNIHLHSFCSSNYGSLKWFCPFR